jgi:hypothetical protein
MRQLAALLSMLIALSAGATEMWRWKDADGVTHFSDRPVPGAERIDVLSKQKSSAELAPEAPKRPTPPPPAEVRFTRCAVTAPANDQVFNSVNPVDVAVSVEPGLQGDYRLQVLLNGIEDQDWPAGALSRTLVNLYRGSYTLSARVLDLNGRAVCTGPVINFHVRQPSILAPGRRPPAKKP